MCRPASWGMVLVLGAALATQAWASDKTDYWMGYFQGDVKTGSVHVVRQRISREGKTFIKTDITKDFAFFQGKEIKWRQFIAIVESPAGSVDSFSISSTTEKGRTIIEGRVEGEIVRFFYKAPETEPRRYNKKWDPTIIGPAAVERLRVEKGFGRNVSYTYKTYSCEYIKAVTVHVSGRGRTRVNTLDGPKELETLKVESSISPRAPLWEYRDKAGRFVQTTLPEGTRVQARMSPDAAQTRQKGVLALYPVVCAIQVPGTIFHPRAVSSAVLTLEVTGKASFKPITFKGPGQRKTAGGVRSVTLALSVPKTRGGTARPVTDAKLKSCLEANYFFDFGEDDGGLSKKAASLVSQEKKCLAAARKLSAYISSRWVKLPLNAGFGTASTAFARGEGDCSELAVLLCAMARSVGIPARLAGGFSLQGAYLVFHVWAEVWDKTWHPLDPTNPDGGFDALHFRFGATDLNGPAPEYVLLSAGSVARQLRVVNISYWLNGRESRPGPMPSEAHAKAGNTYTNHLLGFTFQKPADWSISWNLRGIDGGVVAAQGRNRRERVLFRPHMAEYSLNYGSLLRRMEVNYNVGPPREVMVDGRKAVIVQTSMKGGGYSPLTCYILVDDVMYAVESNNVSEDNQKAFQRVLGSLKFRKRKK